jgi:PIN domain nuclease of toxin-antitoxin system
MRVLLDTHAFLWWTANDPKLSAKARETIALPDAKILFSSIGAWELVIKKLLGRFVPSGDINELVRSQIAVNRFEVLALTLDHTLRFAALPDHHKDPFDRALIARAQVENIPILSADRAIARYPVEIIW